MELVGLLNNPITLMIVSLICQFAPKIRTIVGNSVIPILTTILAFLSQHIAPQAAHANAGPVGQAIMNLAGSHLAFDPGPVVAASIFGSLFAGLGSAVVQSAQAYLYQRMFAWPGRTLPKLPADSK